MDADLIERAGEIERLARSLESVAAGIGRAAVIAGPAGTGKTALLDAVAQAAREADWLVRRAVAGPPEREDAFGVLQTLLDRPAAGAVSTVAHCLFGMCAELSWERPVVLLVDDAHWADPDSVAVLAQLARRVAELPLLMVVAGHDVPAELGGVATVLEPGPLSAGGSAELVRRELPGAPDDLLRRCHRLAGGNPWLVGELARQAAERSPRISDAGRGEVRRRLAQLTEAERRVARAAAVVGDAPVLAAVAGIAPADLPAARGRLAVAGLWFAHPSVTRAVHDDMPAAEREALHRAAAAELPPAAAAVHLLRCGPAGDPGASAALCAAAESSGPIAAAVYLERALLEGAPGDDRAAILIRLGDALFHAGLPGSRERLREAVPARPGEALARLAALEAIEPQDATLAALFEPDKLAGLDAMLHHPEWDEERARRVLAVGDAGHRAWLGAETGRWNAAACAALARASAAADLGRLPLAVRVLLVTDQADAAERAIVRLADVARASVPLRAVAARLTAELALRCGRLHEAARAADADVRGLALVEQGALEEARATLDGREGLAVARLLLAEGDFEGAAVAAREAGRHDLGNPAWLPWRATLALALAHLGRSEEAVAVAADDVERAAAFGAPTALAVARHARCVSEPDAARRVALAGAALDAFAGPAVLVRAQLQLELGSALVRRGKRVAARDVLRAALAEADAASAAPLAARARRELVASGARPRRAAIAGLAALTPRQRQVCELAAAGKSNRAIAHALFLSVKTVESHLARAYGTLGVPDRAGMVASLAA